MSGLSIRAVAELVFLSTDTIRRAEHAGLIPQADRTPGGHRRWPVSALGAIAAGLRPPRHERDLDPLTSESVQT